MFSHVPLTHAPHRTWLHEHGAWCMPCCVAELHVRAISLYIA